MTRRHAIHFGLLAALAVVLGIASTLVVAATGVMGPGRGRCVPPAAAGQVVEVTTTDMGPMMRSGYGRVYRDGGWRMRPMRLLVQPGTVTAGSITLRVRNHGALTHEVLVLPLADRQSAGQRAERADGRIDESGSLAEASTTCGPGAGSGIAPGSLSWTTVTLPAGHYELVCNIPGHYAAGAFAELEVTDDQGR